MFHLFRAFLDRIKVLLATSAALKLEADAFTRHAQRKAELPRLAQQYEAEKLPTVSLELRQHAEALDLQQPLAGVATALASWQGADAYPALPAPADLTSPPIAPQERSRRPVL